MRSLAILTAAAGVFCAASAFAAPVPSSQSGIDGARSDNVVSVKMKKMKKKRMMKKSMGSGMSGSGMKGGQIGGGQEMKGGTNSPVQGGGR